MFSQPMKLLTPWIVTVLVTINLLRICDTGSVIRDHHGHLLKSLRHSHHKPRPPLRHIPGFSDLFRMGIPPIRGPGGLPPVVRGARPMVHSGRARSRTNTFPRYSFSASSLAPAWPGSSTSASSSLEIAFFRRHYHYTIRQKRCDYDDYDEHDEHHAGYTSDYYDSYGDYGDYELNHDHQFQNYFEHYDI